MKYNPFQAKGRYKVTGELGPEITPPRFVYHLDFSGGRYRNDCEYLNYKRLNIAKEGLFGQDMGNGGVWVNVYQPNPYRWFPITLDLWDCDDDYTSEQLIGKYDVWRIDTTKIKNKWFIDPNMKKGEVMDLSKVLYTPETIPGKALQLFHMELDKEILYKYEDYKLAPLVPVKKINEYIRYIHRRKRIYADFKNAA
jgi:hypothetical protein